MYLFSVSVNLSVLNLGLEKQEGDDFLDAVTRMQLSKE